MFHFIVGGMFYKKVGVTWRFSVSVKNKWGLLGGEEWGCR